MTVQDPILEQAITHPISDEQHRWLTANGYPGLMTSANEKCVAAVEAVIKLKNFIERDQRLTNEAKLQDITTKTNEVVAGLTTIIGEKQKALKIKRKTVLERMAAVLRVEASGQAEHRRVVEDFAASLDEEGMKALQIKAEDDSLSPVELILLQAAEDADLATVGAISEATPTWKRLHQVRPETIDKARDRVMITANKSDAAELDIITGLTRGLDSSLKATKAAIARESGVPLDASPAVAA